MRTTVTLDDELVRKARHYTGIEEKSALLRRALEELVAHEAGRRLVKLGGTMPDLEIPARRRTSPDQTHE